jgi:secondary thiamine-phosphate synthase enzyme
MFIQYKFSITTSGRGLVDITEEVKKYVKVANVEIGLCHLFLHHTSASLTICENHDPLVQKDLEAFMLRLIPDGDPLYEHIAEGPDDMPSHVRSILTQSFLMLPISNKELALGSWQGLYLWEHRLRSHHRHITVTIQGN